MSTATTTRPAAETVHVRERSDLHRQIRLTITFGIVTALLLYFALAIDDGSVRYILGERVTKDFQPKDLDGTVVSWLAVAVAALALVLAALNRFPRGVAGALLAVLVGLMFYLGFLMWAYADQGEGFVAAIANPIPGTIRIATPLVLGALAGVLCERAGVINIAIEGQFLAGAFLASVFASLFFSAYMGLLGGIVAGLLIAAMLALFALKYQVNQVVLGVVLVAFASGLTSFLLGQIPGDPKVKQYFNEPPILEPIRIPGLADIPLVGEALFDQTVLVYLMYVSVVAVTLLLFQTRWGLRARSVGEHPKAADTVGIKVNRIRWQAVLLGGVFAGLGGAYYTVGSTGAFDRDVSAGTGFIALAAVIMGRWHPVGATFAAVFFGFMWNLQNQLSFVDKLPSELLGAAPYLATIIAVAGFVGRVRPPAADGEPYVKSEPADGVDWDALKAEAVKVSKRAYVPYSHYPVGAAALVDDGRLVVGCNVENAGYGVTLCAECGLVSSLHATGGGRLTHFVCVNAAEDVIMPCGRCRQLLWENGGASLQLLTVSGVRPMTEVLPDAFGPEDLEVVSGR